MISLAQMLAYPAQFLPQVRNASNPMYMNSEAGSWYTSLNSLTSPIGSLMAGTIMDRYGRRIALAVPLIPYILSWTATAVTESYYVLFICRAILGACGGFGPPACQVCISFSSNSINDFGEINDFDSIFQIYLAECADSNLRSFTMNVGYVSLSLGFLLTFAFGGIMDWRSLAWCGTLLPAITLIAIIVIVPETPLYLIRHDRVNKALENLIWLRGDANIARNELNENLVRLEQERATIQQQQPITSNLWRDFSQPYAFKPIVIIFAFLVLFNMSGTYLIVYYALDIISQVNLVVSSQNANVIISSVRLIVTIGFCWLFMHIKRRQIYLLAGIGSTISTIALAIFLYSGKIEDVPIVYHAWIAGSLLLIYVATNTGFMIAPGFMTGELLPARIRGRFAGYIYTFFSVITFAQVKFFPMSNAYIGLVGVLFVFGVASLLTTSLIYFMIPETKGKSLLEIEQYFQQSGWIYKSHRNVSS